MGYQLKTSEFLLLSLFCIASKKLFIHVAKILVSSFFSATIYAYLHLLVEFTY